MADRPAMTAAMVPVAAVTTMTVPTHVLHGALLLGVAAHGIGGARPRRGLRGAEGHDRGGACTCEGQQQFSLHFRLHAPVTWSEQIVTSRDWLICSTPGSSVRAYECTVNDQERM